MLLISKELMKYLLFIACQNYNNNKVTGFLFPSFGLDYHDRPVQCTIIALHKKTNKAQIYHQKRERKKVN